MWGKIVTVAHYATNRVRTKGRITRKRWHRSMTTMPRSMNRKLLHRVQALEKILLQKGFTVAGDDSDDDEEEDEDDSQSSGEGRK